MSQALVKIAAGWLLGLMLAVAACVVAINIVNNSIAGPQQPVREYIDALQKGEGEKALGLLRASVPQSNAAMLDGTALQTAAARISGVKYGEAEDRGGNQVMVPVDYTIDGSKLRTEFLLEKSGTEWLFFHKWAIVPAALPVLDVTVVNANEATLNGVPVNMPNGRNSFAVFYPGEYEASLAGEYFSAPPTKAIHVPDSANRHRGPFGCLRPIDCHLRQRRSGAIRRCRCRLGCHRPRLGPGRCGRCLPGTPGAGARHHWRRRQAPAGAR